MALKYFEFSIHLLAQYFLSTMKAARKTHRTQRTQAQWSELLAQHRDSALTQIAFCEAHGLAICSFTTALRREREASGHSEIRNAFIPVLVDIVPRPS